MGAAASFTLEDAVDYFGVHHVVSDNLTANQVDLRLHDRQFVFHMSDIWGHWLYNKATKQKHRLPDLIAYTAKLYELAEISLERQSLQAAVWNHPTSTTYREFRFELRFLTPDSRYHASVLLRKTLLLLELEPQERLAEGQVLVNVPITRIPEVKKRLNVAMGDVLTWVDFTKTAVGKQ